MDNFDTMSVNAVRALSADTIQKANSGHPGLPSGAAPIAYELWTYHINHNPANPQWENRDHSILSGGHGPVLLYSPLHLPGCGDLSGEDIMNFRQVGSLIPGRPEYRHTVGVEATTGPLEAGMGMAVGTAIAEFHLAVVFNKDEHLVMDHYTYVLGDGGCVIEGISSEVFSLTGTLGLSELTTLYDSNQISIEGSMDIVLMESVQMWVEAFGFQTIMVGDGDDLEAADRAIEEAKADTERPSLTTVKTQIGYGCPTKQGKTSAYEESLGAKNVLALKENLGQPSQEPFYVPEEVYENYRSLVDEKTEAEAAWNAMFTAHCKEHPEIEELWDQYHDTRTAESLWDDETFWAQSRKPDATRSLSGKALNYMKGKLPNLLGGSADLAPSNKTNMSGAGDFSKETPKGRNLYFGVRELTMTAIGNRIMLHGGPWAYVMTFFVFNDYVKLVARLSALMGVPLTFVLTRGGIGVGEDGPTHEPIEQLAMLRAMSNFHVSRPCDAVETAAAWYSAVTSEKIPTALVLMRQNLVLMAGSSRGALKGGYVIDDCEGMTGVVLMTGGSEIELAVKARAVPESQGTKVQAVSMSCTDLFEEQTKEYKESVLPEAARKRTAIEVFSNFGWDRYIGLDGAYVTMKGFGASGPTTQLFEYFGFTVDHVVATVKGLQAPDEG